MGKLRASDAVPLVGSPLDILKACGGYYECPKGDDGRRLGPLVGYAGRYQDDGGMKQYVGDIYCNFAAAEQYPHVLQHFARMMHPSNDRSRRLLPEVHAFCGAPLGGYSFADALGLVFDRRSVKIEKKVTAVATSDAREQVTLVFGRHSLQPGDLVAVAEDVCNNFAITKEILRLVESFGASVVAIVCLLNRSPNVDEWYRPAPGELAVPVFNLVRQPIAEYRQDHPMVADDIKAGKVVSKPKHDWPAWMAARDAGR